MHSKDEIKIVDTFFSFMAIYLITYTMLNTDANAIIISRQK